MPPAHGRLKENRREDEYTSVMASLELKVQPTERSSFVLWRSTLDELLLNVPSERDPAVTDPAARAKLCVWSLLPRDEQDDLYDPLHQLAHQQGLVYMTQLVRVRGVCWQQTNMILTLGQRSTTSSVETRNSAKELPELKLIW